MTEQLHKYEWACLPFDAKQLLKSLQWRHNERDGISNNQPHDCLLNRLFKAQIKENIKFTAPRASNAENVSIWWRHHAMLKDCSGSSRVGWSA